MLNAATTMDDIFTGVKEIAELCGGGIRAGSLVLIEGQTKTGKSVLSQHLAYSTLRSNGNRVAYYTTYNSIASLITQMDSLSLVVQHDFATDRLRIYPVSPPNSFGNPQKSLQFLINHISELPKRFNQIVIDSITPLVTNASPVSKIDFLQACKELCAKDRSIILVVDTHALEKSMLSRAYLISDYYLTLRSENMILESGQVDDRVIKVLGVLKLRGAECPTMGDIKFEIKPKVGIQILPLVKVKI